MIKRDPQKVWLKTGKEKIKLYKRLIVISGLVVVLFAYALAYLAYTDKPIKSDAIVLFVGPDYEARLKEAHKLIEEGYANTIIIPVQNNSLFPYPSRV